MNTMVIWLNDEIITDKTATVAASAAGLLLGWGVFTTLGIWNGHAFAVERHLARLRRDAAALDIPIAFDDDAIRAALQTVIEQNQVREGHARCTATRRGDGRWNRSGGGDLSIMAAAAEQPAGNAHLRLVLSPYRIEKRRPLSGIKATSYLDYQWAWREAVQRGFQDAVLCNSQGVICECTRANLFWARRNELHTPAPDTGCLPGIAREIILEWAGDMALSVREGVFSIQELAGADEVFVTAATTGPRAVEVFCDAWDESGIEHFYGAPGPLTQRLQKRWSDACLGGE